MKGTIIGISKKRSKATGEVYLFLDIQREDGSMVSNKAPESLHEKLSGVLNTLTDLQVKKVNPNDKLFTVVGIGPYPPSSSSGGYSKGGFKKSGGFSKNTGGYKKDPAESRRIVFQNSMAHATALAIHNAGKGKVDLQSVIADAQQVTDVIMSGAASIKVAKSADPDVLVESEEDVEWD